MKMKKLLLLSMVIAGLFASCTDILDTSPYNKPASATMWTTENFTHMGMAGVYHALRQMHWVNGRNEGWFSYDCYSYTGQMRENNALHNGSPTVSWGDFSNHWQRIYEGVHRANDAILNIPLKSPVSDELKAQYIAEAKFLRALFYYKLNELFRGVPIYLEPVTVEECIKTQDTEEAVWQQIIQDLTDGINEPNLPNNDFKDGRVNKGAAYALRGKVYMQQKKWENAIADFAKVGECGFELFQGGYKELFTVENERCKEMIFSMQNVGDAPGYGGSQQFYIATRSMFGWNWNTHMPSPKGVDLYENEDGTPFDWEDIIPGYTTMTPKDREVYFLRDTLKGGVPIDRRVSQRVQARLNGLPAEVRPLYLPEGNEARVSRAYVGRDPRLGMCIFTPYSTFLGTLPNTATEIVTTLRWPSVDTESLGDVTTDTQNYFYYLYRKFVDEGANTIPARDQCLVDEPLIRYGDVILMWAEALVELNRLTEAAEKVNMIRGRTSVDMPDVQYADQDELREKVRKERRIELLLEGVTFFDEMRWRTLEDSKFNEGNGVLHAWGGVATTANTWAGDHLYTWPAPAIEIERNPNLKKTPGWTY